MNRIKISKLTVNLEKRIFIYLTLILFSSNQTLICVIATITTFGYLKIKNFIYLVATLPHSAVIDIDDSLLQKRKSFVFIPRSPASDPLTDPVQRLK